MLSRAIIRSEVTSTKFGVFTDEAKKELSVVSIKSAETLNAERKAIEGGLYDPAMGPLDPTEFCKTCNMNFAGCPGHVGHVELDFPVYYPVYFNDLIRILRAKCVFCHRLRMSSNKVRVFLTRLKLLEMGDFSAADTVMDILSPKLFDSESFVPSSSSVPTDGEERLALYERRYEDFVRRKKTVKSVPDLYIKTLQRETIDQFMKACIASKKCETCGGYSPTFRKDGNTKIFQKPIAKKYVKQMAPLKLRLKSALEALKKEEDSSDDERDLDGLEDSDASSDGTDSEEDDSDSNGDVPRKVDVKTEADKYFTAMEVEAQMQMLWLRDPEIMNFIWTRSLGVGINIDIKTAQAWSLFFTRVVVVPPNKFRPASVVADRVNEHPQNTHIRKIIEENSKLRLLHHQSKETLASTGDEGAHLSKIVTGLIALQTSVNNLMDSSKAVSAGDKDQSIGVRQLLERKEGLFRRNMMGKRVNYCCRSVISPDNYLGTNEIGIPLHFAKELHYPVAVNDHNIQYLRKLVENGPHQYPGANQIETADGQIIKLDRLSDIERVGKAKLLNKQGMKVYRHLIDGDALLVNRQPSLHKASIMAHRARVLKHVKEQTLRMHYANCSSYNADFDGDEMNCHFVQNEIARAEAYTIANTDNQYIVPTSGNPIRGLIQDHVSSAVKLTCKNTFLTKAEFQQLVFIAVHGLPGTEIVTAMEPIVTPPPAIWKPKPLWTGKQVISALLAHLCRHPLPSLHLDNKARTPATAFGAEHHEHEVVIRHGELLLGVIDKNSIGNASLGLVHAVYELYGAELAARLLNSFARLFTYHLQNAGHSCLVEDLVLQEKADAERRRLLDKLDEVAQEGLMQFLEADHMGQHHHATKETKHKTKQELRTELAQFLNGSRDRKDGKVKLDGAMQQVVNKSASDVIKVCLATGLRTSFLNNHFALMVLTGAKGSIVNQSQITCFLGQQALEGQRVPVMASGKTLPSFLAFDGSARAGGFVRDRFLTGVKPQEYYFHCMAGREGLVDTAVKTSRSGYLQRCLVKHLEELNVCYDYTVRDSGHNVVQFLYGDDGIDTVNNALLGGQSNQLLFLARNHKALTYKFSLHEKFFQQGLDMDTAVKHHDVVARAKQLVRDAEKVADQRDAFVNTVAQKGNVILARRRKDKDLPWSRDNVLMGWFPAEIIKVRSSDKDASSSTSDKKKKHHHQHGSSGFPLVDLLYYSPYETQDGDVEKKVPLGLLYKPPLSSAGVAELTQPVAQPVYFVRPGLPDPAMAVLKLGSTVGACSEKVQAAFRDYVLKNPDGILTTEEGEQEADKNSGSSSRGRRSSGVVPADAMELLLWVKFMRSFANPGESVGCVAAQSVGEPSTQMTLNTFHLAGHGGANVTLGIPRLREILMTASRTPKTPTMTLPCVSQTTRSAAQALARHLSRLTLAELLDHRGGVIVGEQIVRASSYSRWERKYRLRLQLLPLASLHAAFSVTCAEIVQIVESTFLSKLEYLIKLEQRRAGESTSGKNDPLKSFRGLAPGRTGDIDDAKAAAKRNGDDNDHEHDDHEHRHNAASAGAHGAESGKGRKGGRIEDGEDSETSDDEDGDGDEDSVRLGDRRRSTKQSAKSGSYDEEDDEDEADDEDDEEEHDGDEFDDIDLGGKKNKTSKKKVIVEDTDSLNTEEEEEIDRFVADLKEYEAMDVDDDDDDDDRLGSNKKKTTKKDASEKAGSKQKKGSSSSSSSKKGSRSSNVDEKNAHRLVEFSEAENWVQVTMYLPVTSRRILMAQLAERAAHITTIRSTRNIARAYVEKDEGRKQAEHFLVGTEGVNFAAVWALPDALVDHNNIVSNDVWQILCNYGVEAARAAIVREIQAVFAVYGIDVNARHLSLIADFMTRSGGYNAMNRIGMLQCASPFLQMSFETTCTFLTKAVQEGLHDNQESPSARIVLGSAPRAGTGCFELLTPFAVPNKHK